jgi:hypothetical protein
MTCENFDTLVETGWNACPAEISRSTTFSAALKE